MGIENGNTFFSEDYQDVDLELKALEIVYRKNGAAVEGMADRNGHRRTVVGEGGSVNWGGAPTKGKGRE